MTKKTGSAKKYIIVFASLSSVFVLILSLIFIYLQSKNIKLIQETVLVNGQNLLFSKSENALKYCENNNLKDIKILTDQLTSYCRNDQDFLGIMIFTPTSDENFFRLESFINLNPAIQSKIKINEIVREETENNFLRDGLFKPVYDPLFYSKNGIYWQYNYYPFKLNNTHYVIQFLVSSTALYNNLEEQKLAVKQTISILLVVTISAIILIFISSLVFMQKYSYLINQLSGYMKRVAGGEQLKLDDKINNELSELFLSFNNVAGEIKEKSKIIEELGKQNSLDEIFKFGVNLLKENRINEAISIFNTLILLKPEGFGSYFNLGVAYAKNQMYDISLDMFKNALKAKPDDSLTLSYISKVERLQLVNNGKSSK